MKKLFLLSLLLVGCTPDPESEPGAKPSSSTAARQPGKPEAPGRIATLTGLYEGETDPPHQMCVVGGKGGESRFGLVTWGQELNSCSGSGTISREGGTVRLTMTGESACVIEASISGKTIRFPATVPQGCAYYCGARATLAGVALTQKGTGKADAMRAKDLIGEPLCGGEGR